MSDPRIYRARADAGRARPLAETGSPFTITIRFGDGLTDAQRGAFAAAADRWVTVIVGDLPEVTVDGEVVDDVLIVAGGKDIDGEGKILGQAGITHVRPAGPEPWALLPAKGIMEFDRADLARMEAEGTLGDVITHEMGHVLGVGSLWNAKGLLVGKGTSDPSLVGAGAMAEYRKLRRGVDDTERVPVENRGGPGTRDVHWREAVFGNELMTGFVGSTPNPLSRLTVANLGDMGYQVDVDAADDYELPTVVTVAGTPKHDDAAVLRATPVELPRDALTA